MVVDGLFLVIFYWGSFESDGYSIISKWILTESMSVGTVQLKRQGCVPLWMLV